MQSVIEVQCPFCKVRGQIVTPPIGSIIVGPCPQCGEIVLLFCGVVLPLDKEIILNGEVEDKKQHLNETIMELVTRRIDELVENAHDQETAEQEELTYEEDEDVTRAADCGDAEALVAQGGADELYEVEPVSDPITDEEVRDFVNIDLHLIDRKAYFDKVFGKA